MTATERSSSDAVRPLLVVALLIVIVAGLRAAAGMLVPLLLALFVATLLQPLHAALRRRGAHGAVARCC